MRCLRISAASPRDATRTRMTGFNLFVQETQRQQHILRAKNLKDGEQNMRKMAEMWAQLTVRRRVLYNERARQRNALLVSDPVKKNNTFNLLMRLFGGEKILLHAGDEMFTALMAKSTMQAMKSEDKQRLRAKLQIKNMSAAKQKEACSITSTFKRFANPHMMFFSSFTEMQRSVAPTRQSAFSAISKLVSLSNVSESGEEYVIQNYSSLSTEESFLFAPISDIEAPFFEVFCATRCGHLDYRRFNILQLFTAFRGIDVEITPNPTRERVYRSLLSSDRTHDGAYYRARRCLERVETLRSSDCGLYIAKRTAAPVKIHPATYSIESSWDEVAVATMLAETRHEQSVYDDVLVRAAKLRSAEKNAQLDLYHVRLEEEVETAKEAAVVKASKQKAKNRAAKETLAAVEAAAEEEEVVGVVDEGADLPLRAETLVKRAAVRQDGRLASPAKQRASSAALRKAKREADDAEREQEAAAAEAAAEALVATKAAPTRAKKAIRQAAARSKSLENELLVAESEEGETAAAPRKSPLKPLRVQTSPTKTLAHVESAFSAEDFLGSDEAESELEEEPDNWEAADSDDDNTAEASDTIMAAAPLKKGKSEKRRTVRSQLTDPTSMLPAKARAEKIVTKHASFRKKLLPVTTKPQTSPYVPPGRNVSFTENIRAMLSSSF